MKETTLYIQMSNGAYSDDHCQMMKELLEELKFLNSYEVCFLGDTCFWKVVISKQRHANLLFYLGLCDVLEVYDNETFQEMAGESS